MPKIPLWIFFILALLHFSAVRIDVMDIDAAQYAEISREMLESGNYLEVYDRGAEYLDKPPFLFWVSSLGMSLFGIGNFGFKIFSILFALWGLYATYRLTKLLYGEAAGRMAALILGSCQGMFLMTNDIRTDTILMSTVITAIWLIKEAEIKRTWYNVLGGCAAIAIGMMTKGPIALMVPIFCFGSEWILKRNWKKLFNPYHLLDALIIAVLLIPMSIGLYMQFDMHPEKIVNGHSGVSGLKFFYWTQSFGRITGESPWNNEAGIEFLMLNMLWSFLPWIFLFIPALIINIIKLIKQRFKLYPGQEWITTGGFLLAYLSLGMSNYQLPHYIFVAFPLAAIITTKFLKDIYESDKYAGFYKYIRPFQIGLSCLILIAALGTMYIFSAGVMGIALWVFALAIWLYIVLRKQIPGKMFWASVAAMILANIFITHHFYYRLLQYQVGSQAGTFISDNNIQANEVIHYHINDALVSMHFYANGLISRDSTRLNNVNYVLTTEKGKNLLEHRGYNTRIVHEGEFYRITLLTLRFLNPKTRHEVTTPYYLVKIN